MSGVSCYQVQRYHANNPCPKTAKSVFLVNFCNAFWYLFPQQLCHFWQKCKYRTIKENTRSPKPLTKINFKIPPPPHTHTQKWFKRKTFCSAQTCVLRGLSVWQWLTEHEITGRPIHILSQSYVSAIPFISYISAVYWFESYISVKYRSYIYLILILSYVSTRYQCNVILYISRTPICLSSFRLKGQSIVCCSVEYIL